MIRMKTNKEREDQKMEEEGGGIKNITEPINTSQFILLCYDISSIIMMSLWDI